jgi:xanthine dehydrogenase molybdopterin-binding subunit B
MQALGYVESSAIASTIQDHVASYLDINGDVVSKINLLTMQTLALYCPHVEGVHYVDSFTLPAMWSCLKIHSKKIGQDKEIEAFNSQSKWTLQCLTMVTSMKCVNVLGSTTILNIFHDNPIVAQVGGIEMRQGLYTNVWSQLLTLLAHCRIKMKVVKILIQ